MSDHDTTPGEKPDDAAHELVRDALPALLHGRASASERARVERHLAECPACDAEYQLLASVRELYPTPPISVDRIAAAVRARTVPAPAVVSRQSTVRPGTRASASAMPSALRAIPASRSSM